MRTTPSGTMKNNHQKSAKKFRMGGSNGSRLTGAPTAGEEERTWHNPAAVLGVRLPYVLICCLYDRSIVSVAVQR